MSWLINEVSKMTGVSTYNLRYYEEEGLICPKRVGDSKYRSYDEADIKRIYCISLYRQLGVSVKDMKEFLDGSVSSRVEVLDQVIQITDERMLKLKNIKRVAELLRFYANSHEGEDEEKRKEPPVLTIILSIAIIVGLAVFCLLAGLKQGSRYGYFKVPDYYNTQVNESTICNGCR